MSGTNICLKVSHVIKFLKNFNSFFQSIFELPHNKAGGLWCIVRHNISSALVPFNTGKTMQDFVVTVTDTF